MNLWLWLKEQTICRWRGHRWGHPTGGPGEPDPLYFACIICGWKCDGTAMLDYKREALRDAIVRWVSSAVMSTLVLWIFGVGAVLSIHNLPFEIAQADFDGTMDSLISVSLWAVVYTLHRHLRNWKENGW